ncbi:Cation-independent mannose-6-phosphate receptor CI-MPR [Cytospora paraplurivora]|uniref:Cation-independent mannose-6-phosphate receptor CI-MPR n=1 Tax=Cytospora paraplurivora TaxID=2898453 RepID=A0AAN9UEJ2_9PEZI
MVPQSRLLLLAAAFFGPSLAVDEAPPTATPCTALSTPGGAFFDLRPDIAVAPTAKGKHKYGKSEDYIARGYDYGYNFTLNICDAVIKSPEKVVGIDEPLWKNVSAYYEKDGKVYSLGQQSSTLTPRGTQLVLQYSGGSPCGLSSTTKRGPVHAGASYKSYDDDNDHDADNDTTTGQNSSNSGGGYSSALDTVTIQEDDKVLIQKAEEPRRKSATFAFRCDRESVNPAAIVSFVSADPDECAYLFVVRSQHACAGVQPSKPGSVGPGGVFAIIFLVAIVVYFAGGVVYQRTVANARGWRQLPNYSLWAGIWHFFSVSLVPTMDRKAWGWS